MNEKHLLITGRPASGKTELLIAYANMHPKTTLFLSEESTESLLKEQRGLSSLVKVVDINNFNIDDLERYNTLCIDYLELFSKEDQEIFIKIIQENKICVILTSQVKRGNNEVLKRIDDLIFSRNYTKKLIH
jgi:replication-associated recombination protein RarA